MGKAAKPAPEPARPSSDDDLGGDGHPKIAAFAQMGPGPYYIRVRDEQGSIGPYVLELVDASCQIDADCGCPDQACGEGGTCQPTVLSFEPLGPDHPAEMVVGERRHARLAPARDVDTWAVTLDSGAWRIATSDYCGSPALDTILEVTHTSGGVSALWGWMGTFVRHEIQTPR